MGSSEIQAKLEDIPKLSRAVQDSAAIVQASVVASETERVEIRAQLGGISGLGRVIEDNSAVTRSAMVRLDAYETEIRAMARQTSTDLRGLADEWRSLGPSVCGILFPTQKMWTYTDFPASQLARFNAFLATNPEISEAVSRAIIHDRQKPAELCEQGVRSICETLRQIHQEPATAEPSFSSDRSSTECHCRWFSCTNRYEPLSVLHFRKVFRRQHFESCPKSKTSEDSLEYMMKVVPPKWLLSHTIHLSFSLRIRAFNHGFSIAPIVLGTSRVVDRRASPAFKLLKNLERDLYNTAHIPGLVNTLENSLRDLFGGGLSSPADEDQHGNTILYVLILTL